MFKCHCSISKLYTMGDFLNLRHLGGQGDRIVPLTEKKNAKKQGKEEKIGEKRIN